MSESLSSLLTKERQWVIRSGRSGQKSNVSESLSSLMTKERHEWFARDSSQSLLKKSNSHEEKKNLIFCMFLTVFSFLCPRTNHSRHSSLSRSFFKEWHGRFDHVALYKRATVRESLRSLITNERPWAICSRCSFAHKKRVIRSKNRWANSQPWVMGTQVCLSSLTVRVRESDSAHYTGGKRQYGLKG